MPIRREVRPLNDGAGWGANAWRVVGWEFVQNLPFVGGFVAALRLWSGGRIAVALACAVGGSVVGALLIRLTEGRIVTGHREPWRVVALNGLAGSLLTVALAAYHAVPWAGWASDLLLGAAAGGLLAVGQDLVGGERIGVGHALALAGAGALTLLAVRTLVAVLPALVSVGVVTAAMTLLIVLVDYVPRARVGKTGE